MVKGHVVFLFASPDVLSGGVMLIGHSLSFALLTRVTVMLTNDQHFLHFDTHFK